MRQRQRECDVHNYLEAMKLIPNRVEEDLMVETYKTKRKVILQTGIYVTALIYNCHDYQIDAIWNRLLEEKNQDVCIQEALFLKTIKRETASRLSAFRGRGRVILGKSR